MLVVITVLFGLGLQDDLPMAKLAMIAFTPCR
jgi:hypothetical protein